MVKNRHRERKNKRLALLLGFGVLLMFGFCYLLVPLYNVICKQIGFNGKAASVAAVVAPGMAIDRSRVIKVYFSTSIHGRLNFKFIPLLHTLNIHPGEKKLIYFFAENNTDKGVTVQAIPSITPSDGARYLKKTECFCFTQQFFYPHEKVDMPVYFFIDPAISSDIKEMTLSYTLFDAQGFEKKQPHFTKGRIHLS